MQKKKVAIFYGGRSVEHGVSVNSAKNIFEFIDRELFEPVPIGITRDGRWFLTLSVGKDIEQGKALGLILDAQRPGFILLASDERIKADVAFPVLHGTDGEDGSIQGMIRTMNIPMVGTGIAGSALAMDKIITKKLLTEAGIRTPKFVSYHFQERKKINYDEVKDVVGAPFMVKSANLGSSVGISKVTEKPGFKKAIDTAFRYDHAVIIEQFIEGRELECAVLGNTPPEASVPGEIIVEKGHAFYTFDAKYVDEKAVKIEVPARLDEATIKKVQQIAVKTYNTLRCEDFARIDLFLSKSGKVYVNEVNTIPGFTNASMYPMMWKAGGMSFTELITRLITLALERHDANGRIERDFQSALKF